MRRLLTPQEIIELDQALVEVFALHRDLKSRILTAHHIKFPQLPAILAESFVIVTANKLFGADWKAIFGGSVSDIQLLNPIFPPKLKRQKPVKELDLLNKPF